MAHNSRPSSKHLKLLKSLVETTNLVTKCKLQYLWISMTLSLGSKVQLSLFHARRTLKHALYSTIKAPIQPRKAWAGRRKQKERMMRTGEKREKEEEEESREKKKRRRREWRGKRNQEHDRGTPRGIRRRKKRCEHEEEPKEGRERGIARTGGSRRDKIGWTE